MSNLEKCRVPLLSVLTTVKFETASSLSQSFAALLVPALMFAAIMLERGLLPSLGSARPGGTRRYFCRSRVSRTGLVGPLASGGENDGFAAESEFAVGLRRCSLGITPSRKPETCLILPMPLLMMRPPRLLVSS